MTVKLTGYGACSEVTGSMHMISFGEEFGNLKILLDAGSFQGFDAGNRNSSLPSSIDPMSIRYIFISHGHLDHIGRLPLLVKRGFHGQIISTRATRDISFIVLDNMIKIQNSNSDFEKDKDIGLITEKDIEITKRLFTPIDKDYGKWISEDGKLVVNFINAEHIVGSACIYIEKPIKLLYTGDLGGSMSSLHKTPVPPSGGEAVVDYLIMESTYGNREIGKSDAMVLVNSIKDIRESGGRLLIPILAIDRAEEILALLKSLNVDENVYLDSPMALDVLSVYKYNSFMKVSQKFNRVQIKGRNLNADQVYYPFTPKNFVEITSKSPEMGRGSCIILSSSGMLEGGRIMKYLSGILSGSRNIVLFCSFLGEGTLGKRILDGKKEVYINTDNKMIKVGVEASIRKMDGISGHADKNDILDYIGKFGILPKNVFIVHGEPNASKYLKNEIEYRFGIPCVISKYDVEYKLDNDGGNVNETERRQVAITTKYIKDKGEIDADDFDNFCDVIAHKDFSPRRR